MDGAVLRHNRTGTNNSSNGAFLGLRVTLTNGGAVYLTTNQAEGRTLHRGRGCDACHGLGYRGRVAISEFLPLTSEIQDLILDRASATRIRKQANQSGMKTLAQNGWDKVAQGVTTAEEVLRVTSL